MFTGLVEAVGTVRAVRERGGAVLLSIEPAADDFEVPTGASVSVSGACLTLERREDRVCVCTAVPETVRRTTLGECRPGSIVNLERALRLSDRLDGHVVLGHVDGVGRVVAERREAAGIVRSIEVPEALVVFMAEKGSVAVDGISLTIATQRERTIECALIPHTLETTTMRHTRVGDRVNIECDVLARYLVHLLRNGARRPADADGGTLLDRMLRAGY